MLRPPHVKVALLGLVAALVVGGATASLRDTESVFRGGDFETANLSQWRERQCLSERISVGSGRPAAFAGRYRARLEVRDRDVEPQTGSERCELVGAELPRERERWFRQAIYVPTASDPPDSWQIMAQWYSNSGGSPPLALFNDTGLPMRWSLRSGDSTRVYWRSRELRRNRWHEIVVGVYLSESRKRGWVEVWLDGRRQQLKAEPAAPTPATSRPVCIAIRGPGSGASSTWTRQPWGRAARRSCRTDRTSLARSQIVQVRARLSGWESLAECERTSGHVGATGGSTTDHSKAGVNVQMRKSFATLLAASVLVAPAAAQADTPSADASATTKKALKSALKRDLKRALGRVKKVDLAKVEARGITLKRIRALEAGKASFSAVARSSSTASTAKKLVTVTRGSKKFSRRGKAQVRLKVTRSGKSVLGTASKITLRVKGTFAARVGKRVKVTARVTLARKPGPAPTPQTPVDQAPLPFDPSDPTVPSPIPGNSELLHSQAFDFNGPWPGYTDQCGHAVQWDRQAENGYAHLEVRPDDLEVAGEERCEISLGGYGNTRQPGEYWYRTIQRTGAGFPQASGWAYIQQWHEDGLENPTTGQVDAAMFVNSGSTGRMAIDGEFLESSQSSPFPIGDWHEFTVHGVWTDQASGYLEWWIDRKYVGRTDGVTSQTGGRHYWKGGITRDPTLDTLQSTDISSVEVYRAP
jgi:Polysaccharide lyase